MLADFVVDWVGEQLLEPSFGAWLMPVNPNLGDAEPAPAEEQVGPPQDVYDEPANTFVAAFLGGVFVG